MQLKKRFSVRKSVAAGAMAVAMFATSMPALASNGLGFGLGLDVGAQARFAGNDDHKEGKAGLKLGINTEIKEELKAIKLELKLASQSEKSENFGRSATLTSEVELRKQCRKTAQADYDQAMSAARAERDADMKKARESYLAALKAARAAYHASIATGTATVVTGSTTGTTSATVTVQVDARVSRKTYQQAVKKAQKDFRDAKDAASSAYHADTKAARDAHKAAYKACK
ncbi:MAG: hypothetical protein AAB554_05545 [Patescibacteria group bacterium]